MINKTEKVLRVKEKQPVSPVDTGQKIFIFPWVIKSGYQNLSEKGYIDEDTTASSVAFFDKVFTGKDAIIVVWEDSTKLVKIEKQNKLKYDFSVGKFYLGQPMTGMTSQATEIQEVEGNEDFLGMKETQDITLYFEKDEYGFFPTQDDFYKLYTIPELGNNKWFFISQYSPVFDDSNTQIIAATITFSTLSDKLNTTGRAIEQFVQYAAPGEPFARPQIIVSINKDNGLTEKFVKFDEDAWLNVKPVKTIQVELQGSAALTSIMVIGRNIYFDKTSNSWISDSWDFLFPYKFYTPEINPLNKTGVPSKNFYFFPSEQLTNYLSKDEVNAWKEQNSSLATNESSGKITFGDKNQWHSFVSGDQNPWSGSLGTHSSNPYTLSGSSEPLANKDYFDPNWKPLSFLTDDITIPATQDVYTDNNIYLHRNEDLRQLMIKSSFAMLEQYELPYSYFSTKPYRVSNVPIIGSIVPALMGGDRILRTNITSIPGVKFPMLVPCDLANLMVEQGSPFNTQAQGSNKVWCFLSNLGGQQVPEYFGATTYNTSLFFELTNLIKLPNGEFGRSATIGQSYYEDGTLIKPDYSPFPLPDDIQLQQNPSAHFVIDKVIVKSLFAGDIRISCYDNVVDPNSIWATTISSTAKWLNNSYRNWTTEITCGTWPDRWIEKVDDFTWPVDPHKYTGQAHIDINTDIGTESYNDDDNNPDGLTYNANYAYYNFQRDHSNWFYDTSKDYVFPEYDITARIYHNVGQYSTEKIPYASIFPIDLNTKQKILANYDKVYITNISASVYIDTYGKSGNENITSNSLRNQYHKLDEIGQITIPIGGFCGSYNKWAASIPWSLIWQDYNNNPATYVGGLNDRTATKRYGYIFPTLQYVIDFNFNDTDRTLEVSIFLSWNIYGVEYDDASGLLYQLYNDPYFKNVYTTSSVASDYHLMSIWGKSQIGGYRSPNSHIGKIIFIPKTQE